MSLDWEKAIREWAEVAKRDAEKTKEELFRQAREQGWGDDYAVHFVDGRIHQADELLRFLTTLKSFENEGGEQREL